ncbi:Oxoglutarate/iron-dependent dioxygenase [Corchorus olitorius]|uniref:Oxoglutarate/iron-dependent dioxygenase n=1 Tax=Corchorus olitorius TaxID=93759 RepID=A0A1R3KCV8_9ROSI|nr:Oxoglutarate/iron-dependent dioxygenase [Corchorus olitorius]
MIKDFFETRAGVKGLVDSGITKIPNIFIYPPEPETLLPKSSFENDQALALQIPEIDFQGFEFESEPAIRTKIVDSIRDAAQTWGMFRMVNHGVPVSIMENMLDGVRRFHEQPLEAKKAWYSRQERGQRIFDRNTNVKVAAWRDTVACEFPHGVIDEEIIPEICREATSEYLKCILKVKQTLCELLAEALGLRRDYLASFEGMKGFLIACHYFPACPEPEKTLGTSRHTDGSVLTLLLESNIDGLQVLSNDKFKSVPHRVLARSMGPRISAACFFAPTLAYRNEPITPAEELVSEESPPIYKGFSINRYIPFFRSKDRDGTIALPHFKINGDMET